jgi:hypothetical protein
MTVNYEQLYEFVEPHVTGGDSTVRLTAKQAIDFTRAANPGYIMTDEHALDSFIVTHWAWKVDA